MRVRGSLTFTVIWNIHSTLFSCVQIRERSCPLTSDTVTPLKDGCGGRVEGDGRELLVTL